MGAGAVTPQPLDSIRSYHAHIYFDGPEQRRLAEDLRAAIAERFSVRLGRWHDRLIGPHMRPMYQVAFLPAEFPRFVPWLMVNRRGLAVLIHPNTGRSRTDHLVHAMWLGEILKIDATSLSDDEEIELEMEANTKPSAQP